MIKIITMTLSILKKKKGYILIRDNSIGEHYLILDKNEQIQMEGSDRELITNTFNEITK